MASSEGSKSAKRLNKPELFHEAAFINGKFITQATSGGTFAVTDPATEEVIGHVPDQGVKETQEAIQHAYKAYQSWSKTTGRQRHDIMKKFYDLLVANSDDIATIITLENGKPLADAKGEATYGASFIEWFAEEAVRDYGDIIPSPVAGQRNLVIKQGVGVCAAICPWNFPLAMITRKMGAALAAGCSVVVKAPAETPFTCLALVHLAQEAGIPDGLINIVTTDKHMKDVGKELCENKTVKKITFTGSTGVGKLLMSQASSTLKKCSFELGGNAPFIVFDDADIDAAVAGAIACKFRSSGQTCVCANRLYVQSGVYAEFASRLAEKVDKFKVGNGFEEGTTHGPLIHARAMEKVEKHVEDAKKRGGQVIVGGKRIKGNFFEPTVITDVPNDIMIAQDETFGPVAALFKFETEEDVLKLANDTDVGLSGYFYSKDVGRIFRVAEALEVGMVGVNTGMLSQSCIPFGGIKESGFGREGSKYGLAEYTTVKLITLAI
ncbi:uncharacterized protein L969DRAFT_84187 [Mixia osmundae IAM 14324]|uniref:Succinate-semialdehyde dehydrogenase n=1 Tax=Mixia osmundae (strain CBS 9802 / IAM 14324 / JCM 22182 / KY 12970) TaxID=764103 RepID=G7EAH9_MIXOS|nr:uncharacterized protein L969DRAFT_84187 [Mixia osmundae IAM 14324]KEI42329.1 hypothetical protein L969DRAFT_84187 [Mixia osmundae IAM 14324]GAA99839.1 hypothetical protein E5Q_06542 [Mixia osmundae IAM 14324]